MRWAAVQNSIGGFPFLDGDFDARQLLSLVAGIRWARDGKRQSIDEYVQPAIASTVYATGFGRAEPLSSDPMPPQQLASVQATITSIIAARPDWRLLFAIPIDFRLMPGDLISASSTAYPQVIMLSDRAFKTSALLHESLVHEMSHVWFGMIEEIGRFQTEGAGPRHTFPSGISGNETRTLLIAAAFAACALSYYRAVTPLRPERVPYLRRYLAETCAMLATAPNITECGVAVLTRLRAFQCEEAALA